MRFFLSGASKGGGSQGRQGVTQSFFEQHFPDFAWNILWIVSTNFEQNANLEKTRKKHQKYKKN